jgi:cell division protein FtsW (lipid II flippase)
MLQKLFPSRSGDNSQAQSRFFSIATLFMICYALILSLSPAVREHSLIASYRWTHWIGVAVWLIGFSFLHKKIIDKDIHYDPILLPIVSILMGLGMLSIYRLSIYFGIRQTIWMALGMLILYFGMDRKNLLSTLFKYKYVWISTGILLLALTMVFGTYPGGIGPELWLGGYGIYFQPSEILKILVIVYLAAYFAEFSLTNLTKTRLLLPTLFIIGIASGILIFQRDLGTASIILLIYVLFVYMASQKRRMLVFGALVMVLAAIVGYLLFPVIQVRISSWLHPWANPSSTSYQIVQSLISAASGGIFGSGPGIGNPGVVPVTHSDFIFSAIFEETGLIGATTIILLLIILLHRVMKTSVSAKNKYQRMLGAGLGIAIVLQSILIRGGNLCLLPLTGVTLPFVSYGGSSLISSFFAVLIWQHICAENGSPGYQEIPTIRSYLVIEGMLILGLSMIWLFSFQWGVLRSNQLTSRYDNPRNAIADKYVARGQLLDRNNKVLVETVGKPGAYERKITSPALIQLTGYSNDNYGQTNLESSLNDYLRGLVAKPASEIFWHQLLYSQHPEGLNVRLTINLEIQDYADALMNGHTGALILMNPKNGEIIAMSSYPYLEYEDGDIESAIAEQFDDPDLPLLNRAVHGLYPPGTAIAPFLYNWQAGQNLHEMLPSERGACLTKNQARSNWSSYLESGCDSAYIRLSSAMTMDDWNTMLQTYGFLEVPDFPMTQAELQPYEFTPDQTKIAIDELPLITPLQMAVAASTLSTEGVLTAPVLSYAVETPHQGWVILPKNDPQSIPYETEMSSSDFLNPDEQNFWVFMGKGDRDEEQPVIWYASGTTKYWKGMPLMVVVLLEENTPTLANSIGEDVLLHALQLKE